MSSRPYRAPEVVMGLRYGFAIDMWAAGCVMFEMLSGRPLFTALEDPEHLAMVQRVAGMPIPQFMAEQVMANQQQQQQQQQLADGQQASKPAVAQHRKAAAAAGRLPHASGKEDSEELFAVEGEEERGERQTRKREKEKEKEKEKQARESAAS